VKLSFYTPVAYDYKYAFSAIESYYAIADEILLAIDKDRISWSNLSFEFNETEFNNEIQKIDYDKKIKIIQNNFHNCSSPLQNDTQERNFISALCKKDNYIIAIDSDEVLLNPIEFKTWIDNYNQISTYDVKCTWLTIYKIFDDHILITLPNDTAVIGTNLRNMYKICRITRNKTKLSPLKILHYSWGRSKTDLLKKLNNWTHSKDFDIDIAVKMWEQVTLENFQNMSNLHPLLKCKDSWQKLQLLKLDGIKNNVYS
jgi:hypothetical protein